MRIGTKQDTVEAIRELLYAIERDLDPLLRGDPSHYTGYLAENAEDLHFLVLGLLGDPR